jgi:hypothetical protein
MADVVDADELLRRVRRARDWALHQERHWRHDPSGDAAAQLKAAMFESVRKVLDEVIDPGSHDRDAEDLSRQ